MADQAKNDKKRKRQVDDVGRATKRVLEDSRPVELSIHKNDKWTPVIASTSGLVLPPLLDFKAYTRRSKDVLKPRSTDSIASTEFLLQSSEHPRLDYVGQEECSAEKASMKHYVGIYNAYTNNMELMEARRIVIKGTVREKELTPDSEERPSSWAMKVELGQAFGSKKSKKALASVTENAVSRGPKGSGALDAAAVAVLETMEATTKNMSTREQLAEAAASAKPRPQANKDAQDIRDVYTMENLTGTDNPMFITVSDWLEAVAKGEEVITKSRFVANRLQKVATAQKNVPNTDQVRMEKLRMLRYLLVLVEFYNLLKIQHHEIKIPKREALRNLAGLPDNVVDAVKRRFCSATPVMSQFQVDLVLTHICALACVIDNFEVDLWDLKEDLSMQMKDMSKYFKEIGAKVGPCSEAKRKELGLEKAVAAQRKIAKLKLPLEFPKLASYGGRR